MAQPIVMGLFNDHAVPTNGRALEAFRQGVIWHRGHIADD